MWVGILGSGAFGTDLLERALYVGGRRGCECPTHVLMSGTLRLDAAIMGQTSLGLCDIATQQPKGRKHFLTCGHNSTRVIWAELPFHSPTSMTSLSLLLLSLKQVPDEVEQAVCSYYGWAWKLIKMRNVLRIIWELGGSNMHFPLPTCYCFTIYLKQTSLCKSESFG